MAKIMDTAQAGPIMPRKGRGSSESDIQNQIRVALSRYGIVFRTNAGDFWQGKRIYYPPLHEDILIHLRRVQGLPQGFPDLLYCGFDGRSGFIEVKRPGGHIRKEQQHFLMLMSSYGYPAGIARSPEEALKIIHGLKSQNE